MHTRFFWPRLHVFYVHYFLVIIAILTLPLAVMAAPSYDKLRSGPKVGSKIPHNLATQDQTGTKRNFRSITGKHGLILLFSRSVGWCVYCKAEAVEWNTRLKDAKALGYNVAIVTYDRVARSALFSRRQNIKYPILSDTKSKIIRAFGILNKTHEPGSFAYGIPHPIIFVVGPNGIIKHRFSQGADYSSRPDIDLIFNTLRKF